MHLRLHTLLVLFMFRLKNTVCLIFLFLLSNVFFLVYMCSLYFKCIAALWSNLTERVAGKMDLWLEPLRKILNAHYILPSQFIVRVKSKLPPTIVL